MSAYAMPARAEAPHVTIHPINGRIGAEIRGVDLRRGLTPAEFQVVHDALVAHEVIILRHQDITIEQQMAFGRLFGELSVHPFSPRRESNPEVIVLDYDADHPPSRTDCWHSDETFRRNPPLGTILRARVVPAVGGDTLFASMTAAYRGLSERMKQYIHGLEAIHDFKPFRSLFGADPAHRARLRAIEDDFPNPLHPVVRLHPVSGRRILNVNPQFTVAIQGLKEEESRTILDLLYRQASTPEYQLRVKWEPDMVVMWDNRAVQHYA
ncbi:MAG TPA: TauD/TfdA family dioxygenase, partial [Acetobacteraceae bacterium]|nr:TauD/TfdA family dioxygenase [Acetobacteraceae bacterium]